jgi:hypothetical protein
VNDGAGRRREGAARTCFRVATVNRAVGLLFTAPPVAWMGWMRQLKKAAGARSSSVMPRSARKSCELPPHSIVWVPGEREKHSIDAARPPMVGPALMAVLSAAPTASAGRPATLIVAACAAKALSSVPVPTGSAEYAETSRSFHSAASRLGCPITYIRKSRSDLLSLCRTVARSALPAGHAGRGMVVTYGSASTFSSAILLRRCMSPIAMRARSYTCGVWAARCGRGSCHGGS